jgi:hypothetical protein
MDRYYKFIDPVLEKLEQEKENTDSPEWARLHKTSQSLLEKLAHLLFAYGHWLPDYEVTNLTQLLSKATGKSLKESRDAVEFTHEENLDGEADRMIRKETEPDFI